MNSFIEKAPFIRLLPPVIVGILLSNVAEFILFAIAALAGFFIIGIFFFVNKAQQYNFRWVFGCGAFIALFATSALLYRQQEENTTLTSSDKEMLYKGVVQNIPQEKPRSVACHIKTSFPEKRKIVLYLQPCIAAANLQPGDEILFRATLQPFRNLGNPDDFDYKRYMQIKGFAASAYLSQHNWVKTDKPQHSFYTLSQQIRRKALDFYCSLQLNHDAYAFISALTLGFKTELSDDIRQSFRASGTAHVLAVSGLHMFIIYILLQMLFSFLNFSQKTLRLKYLLIIPLLWGYVFVTGVSPSATRAAIMLTMFSLSVAFKQKGFTYNTFAAAAFFMLLYNPIGLFDIGFQMSFGAVGALLYFMPLFNRIYNPTNCAIRYIWNLFTASLAAQLGVFPIVLYYFGTFPSYFFISNLLLVPLVGIVICGCVPIIFFALLKQTGYPFFEALSDIFTCILQYIINIGFRIARFIESLPFSEITNIRISAMQALLLFMLTFFLSQFFIKKKAKSLIFSQTALLLFFIIQISFSFKTHEKRIVVFNTPGKSDIELFINNKRQLLSLPENGFVPHPEKKIIRLSEGFLNTFVESEKFPVDVLILSADKNFSTKKLLSVFQPEIIVLDSSIPRYSVLRIAKESEKYGVKIHDVSQMGAYSIFL